MKTLARSVKEITGKELVTSNVEGWFRQYTKTIEVYGGKGRKEAVIHEVCHWVISEPWQRTSDDNLGYGHSSDGFQGRDPRCSSSMMEHQERMACHLQRMLYQFAGLPFPVTSPSCMKSRWTSVMHAADVEKICQQATAVGWPALLELAHARR